MEELKSYTDIEQSHKLVEILPIESADACWTNHLFGSILSSWRIESTPPQEYKALLDRFIVRGYLIEPCWSLVALLSVMPQIHEWITPYGHKNDKLYKFDPKICKIWEHSIIPSYKVTYGNELSTDIYDNPIDACVSMIIKLHELNLLHL